MSEDPRSYKPTDADRALFEQIKNLVRNHPDVFDGDRSGLDEHYSNEALIRRRAKEKRQKRQRLKRDPNSDAMTRTRARKWNYDEMEMDFLGLFPPQRDEKGRRKPISTRDRFMQAVWDVENGDDLDDKRDHDATALRIALMAWIMCDPYADEYEPMLTREFQPVGWDMRRADPEGESAAGGENFRNRAWWRMEVFDPARRGRPPGGGDAPGDQAWLGWVRQAWGVVQRRIERSADSEEPADTAPGQAKAKGGNTSEQRGDDGFVTSPADRSAYLSNSKIFNKHTPEWLALTDKQLTKVLDDHLAEIRQYRPRSNRRSVHLADWQWYVDASKPDAKDGDWASPSEVEANKATVRAAKQRGE